MVKRTKATEPSSHIAVFQESGVRCDWHNEEWWFSVVNVCSILTASPDAGVYWRKLKQRINAKRNQPVTFCHGLKPLTSGGRLRVTDCANTEGLFRILQSIPAPKAEPFKHWLAQVGHERVKEIEKPELASARARELYQAKTGKSVVSQTNHLTTTTASPDLLDKPDAPAVQSIKKARK